MNAVIKAAPPHADGVIIVPNGGAALYRVSTDAAALCRDIVLATASNIQGRKYVQVEGWQAIALAHGCAASSGDVIRLDDGSVSATGRVMRIDTGTLIASAEGYVGADEPTWFGGAVTDKWGKTKILPKRADYAIRAMAQTRAISRACRSAFAHVVVMMNCGLSTTPAEEVPEDGFEQAKPEPPTVDRKPGNSGSVAQPPAHPSQAVYESAAKPTARAWIDKLRTELDACTTDTEVAAVATRPDVRRMLDWLKNGALAELKSLLAEALTRVTAPADEPADDEDVFPGDIPLDEASADHRGHDHV